MLLLLDALGSLTGCGVRVAVIDSGVHATHPHVQGVWGGVGIDRDGAERDDYVDRLGHGTAVAAVIREKAPAAEIYAVKVFDHDLRATGNALVAALRLARTSGARIANLSLGSENPDHQAPLSQEIAAARGAGMAIVAAAAQPGRNWLPGSLAGVVGVVMDMRVPRDACHVAIGSDGALVISACGYPRPIPGVPPERNLQGLSFAVANASGMLTRLLEGTPRGVSIAERLRSMDRGLQDP